MRTPSRAAAVDEELRGRTPAPRVPRLSPFPGEAAPSVASARPSRPAPSPGREPGAHRPAPSGSALVSFVTVVPAVEKAEEISDETVPDFSTEADSGMVGVYAMRLTLDIEGNPLVVTDARDNEAMQHVFGMGGRKLHQKSCDAGGNPLPRGRGQERHRKAISRKE